MAYLYLSYPSDPRHLRCHNLFRTMFLQFMAHHTSTSKMSLSLIYSWSILLCSLLPIGLFRTHAVRIVPIGANNPASPLGSIIDRINEALVAGFSRGLLRKGSSFFRHFNTFTSCDGFFDRLDLPVVERKLKIERSEVGNSEGMRRSSGWRTGLGNISSVRPILGGTG